MTAQASACRLWGAKIQSFFPEDLNRSWKHDKDYLEQVYLDWDKHEYFFKLCKERNLVPITSVYSSKHFGKLAEIGFRWIKIGSAQAKDEALIRAAKLVGFKVLVSSGGSRIKDIPVVKPIEGIFHCVSRYPHSPYESNLLRMLELKYRWNPTPFGFSDHTDPNHPFWYVPPLIASLLGASYIEKHFTVLPREETRDGKVSMDFMQAKFLQQIFDMPYEDKVGLLPQEFKCLLGKQTQEERDLITKYSERWNV